MQTDNNLVVYTADNRYIWDAQTVGSGAVRAVMQPDGNFCLRNNVNKGGWCSKTAPKAGAYLVMKDDGHIQIIEGTTVV